MENKEEIDWKKVPMPGSSRPKFNFGEFFKGLWLAYLYLSLCLFGLIIANIIDNRNAGSLRLFIPLLIPAVIWIVYKIIKKIFKK